MTSLTNLKRDDAATLFPSIAHLSADGKAWRVNVSGIVYRSGQLTLGKKLLLGILRRAMRVDRTALESELFRERVQGFMIAPTKRRRLAVRIGDDIFPLARRSKRSGVIHEEITVPVERLVQSVQRPTGNHLASVTASLVTANGHDFGTTAPIHFIPRHGVSVVSDIDDTLKETHVHERHTMLLNTFLREFVPVAGMREVYQRWQQAGAVFHYVSSSPWQLYWPLAKHFVDEDLPLGSFHLRAFRLRDHMLRRIFFGRRPVKGVVIRNLMQRFPQRTFVLVGDSGEYDPEIYGSLARRFPQQVSAILIRRVAGHHTAPFRWERAFRKLDRSLWRLFDDPAEIHDAIPSESLLNGG